MGGLNIHGGIKLWVYRKKNATLEVGAFENKLGKTLGIGKWKIFRNYRVICKTSEVSELIDKKTATLEV